MKDAKKREEQDNRYRVALKAMKMQARVVTESLPNAPDKEKLAKAQKIMAEHHIECKAITIFALGKGGVSIPEMTEEDLFNWLNSAFTF
ncbi:hypothetical protein [Vibrio crassostreae]|uniref:hypothetical protein n=1 Tax=Vibrio crassostreae TaxID=246167 RepID=UPI001B305F52|nr:hypothetical protein [Vibrio crassostreae]